MSLLFLNINLSYAPTTTFGELWQNLWPVLNQASSALTIAWKPKRSDGGLTLAPTYAR
jgi:hypothetical protein